MAKKTNSLFYEKPASKKIAKKVSIESPTAFKRSIRKLKRKGLTTHEKRALVLARNRAGAMLKRKNLSTKEKIQMRKIKNTRLPDLKKKIRRMRK